MGGTEDRQFENAETVGFGIRSVLSVLVLLPAST